MGVSFNMVEHRVHRMLRGIIMFKPWEYVARVVER